MARIIFSYFRPIKSCHTTFKYFTIFLEMLFFKFVKFLTKQIKTKQKMTWFLFLVLFYRIKSLRIKQTDFGDIPLNINLMVH